MCMKVERKCNKSCGLDVKCPHNLMFEHLVPEGGTVWEDDEAWLEEACCGGGFSGFVDWLHFAPHFCHHQPPPGHARLYLSGSVS